jgi:hypothetical protein
MIYKVLPKPMSGSTAGTAIQYPRRAPSQPIDGLSTRLYDFSERLFRTRALRMRVSILRTCLCWAISAFLPLASFAQDLPEKSGGAILHTGGGVWVNGYEAHDSSAVFAGDVVETKSGSTANLSMDGSSVLIAPESVTKFQGDLIELDHGAVSVTTSRGFRVRVKCVLVVPVRNEWTEYAVTSLTPTLQVEARKLDVNVDHDRGRSKDAAANESSERASVHEGEQKSYNETDLCGAPAEPTSPASGISPKWIAAGAGAGGALLLLILVHGGGSPKTPASPSSP